MLCTLVVRKYLTYKLCNSLPISKKHLNNIHNLNIYVNEYAKKFLCDSCLLLIGFQ